MHRVFAARERDRVVRRAAGASRETDDMLGQDPRLFGHVEAECQRQRDGWIDLTGCRPRAEDDLRRVGVAVDVPLVGRGRVARDPERATHQGVALSAAGAPARAGRKRVRERTERDERDLARSPAGLAQDEIHCVAIGQRP
jgi:hypothetical protein